MFFLRYEAAIVITGIGELGGSNLHVLIFPKDPGVSKQNDSPYIEFHEHIFQMGWFNQQLP